MKSKKNLNKVAYEMGVQAFKLPWPDNPFVEETIEHKEWQRGWNDAYLKQQRKTKSIEASRKQHANV